MVTGKYTPPNNPAKLLIIQLIGFPLLKTIINEAAIIPILEKETIVKSRITTLAKIFGLLKPTKTIS